MKRNRTFLVSPLLMMVVALLISSCEKDENYNVPTVTTATITGIDETTAVSGGNVTFDGGAEVTACGVCWSTSQTPSISNSRTEDGTGTGRYTSSLTNLEPNSTYYVRAYATNKEGTSYGNELTFKTLKSIKRPTVTSEAVTAITQTTATAGGDVTSDGGAAVTGRGVCWSTSQSPSISDSKTEDGTGTGNFSSSITNLEPNSTYYVRAYATNNEGTSYGSEVSFTTPVPADGTTGTLDYNGYTYKTVYINGKEWLAENLQTTKYNDGTPIANVTGEDEWRALTTGAYCWYANSEETIKDPYGALYNWYAVNTGKLAPKGWHVPTNAEWTKLTDYLGDMASGKLKEAGNEHWASPNSGATNETGFTALPGGYRINGIFDWLHYYGYYWCATEANSGEAWYRLMYHNRSSLVRSVRNKKNGFSVRCVRD